MFPEFFVEQARKSGHAFPSRTEEEAALIYNYSPTFTGEASVDYTMVQDYLFEDVHK